MTYELIVDPDTSLPNINHEEEFRELLEKPEVTSKEAEEIFRRAGYRDMRVPRELMKIFLKFFNLPEDTVTLTTETTEGKFVVHITADEVVETFH